MKKVLTIVLLALLCVSTAAFVSCKNTEEPAAEVSEVPTSTSAPTSAPATQAPSSAPTVAPDDESPTDAPKKTDEPDEKVNYQQPGSVTLSDGTEHGVYVAKKTSAEIVVDGVMDDAYKAVDPIEVAAMAEGSTDVRGDAYFIWDADYLYIFVNVEDWDANEYSEGEVWLSDSVEVVIDTYNKAETLQTYLGGSYRGETYVGEGQFRLNVGSSELTGMHWMMDNPDIFKQGASAVLKYGYTAEYKIGWGTIAEGDGVQPGDQIGFSVCINDGDLNHRTGVAAIEEGMIHAWEWAGALAKLNLVE